MVRFHWHVEEGFGAWVPCGGMRYAENSSVQHVDCDVEIPGETERMRVCFTVPAGYLAEGQVKDVGVLLGHGDDADEWQGPLLTGLAVALAEAGAAFFGCCFLFVAFHSWPWLFL
jgi:hypothetical protein